jgi:hypothetical protein
MSDFKTHLMLPKGSICKAVRTYKAERRWLRDEWYLAWDAGLAEKVELAVSRMFP